MRLTRAIITIDAKDSLPQAPRHQILCYAAVCSELIEAPESRWQAGAGCR